ncbi:unnamed protein product, partial [Didymodactylos carnosus]
NDIGPDATTDLKLAHKYGFNVEQELIDELPN